MLHWTVVRLKWPYEGKAPDTVKDQTNTSVAQSDGVVTTLEDTFGMFQLDCGLPTKLSSWLQIIQNEKPRHLFTQLYFRHIPKNPSRVAIR